MLEINDQLKKIRGQLTSEEENSVESFWQYEKRRANRHVFKDINDLAPAVDEYIQFYNEPRPHRAQGMMTPCKFEDLSFIFLSDKKSPRFS